MNLFGRFRAKYGRKKSEHIERTGRRQHNAVIDAEIADYIRVLAADMGVTASCMTEHLLQIGCFSFTRAIQTPQVREALRQHLLNAHELGDGNSDDASVLRIGENNGIRELTERSKPVAKAWNTFQVAMRESQRLRNPDIVVEPRKALVVAAVEFANFLEENPLPEPNGNDTSVKK